MRIAVLDTETTGIEDLDQVLELAVVNLEPRAGGADPAQPTTYEEVSYWDQLICPTVPITVGAMAAHHIRRSDVEGCPSFHSFVTMDMRARELNTTTVMAAHNANFDLSMLQQSCVAAEVDPGTLLPPQHICTWVCAKHLYPDAPSHSNQALRYYLGLDEDLRPILSSLGLAPHRALPDAVVTARILRHMLEEYSAEELIRLAQTPILLRTCRMRKHAGKSGEEVCRTDRSYVTWMLSQGEERKLPDGNKVGFDADTLHTIRYHLGLLEKMHAEDRARKD